jgi:hypothetical protein
MLGFVVGSLVEFGESCRALSGELENGLTAIFSGCFAA